MNELDELKQQNKQLKALLKNAVQLLNRYKKLLLKSARKTVKKRKLVKKKTGALAARARVKID